MRCVAIGSSADAGSSISRIFGLDRQRARDAQPLLLAARERQRRLVQPVLHFVPDRRRLQALLDPRRRSSRAARASPLIRRP